MATLKDNLSGYRDRVRRWLREVDPDLSFWSDTFLTQQINTAYRRRCAQLVMAHEGYFTNVAIRDLEANKARYAWPNGFERLLKLELVRTDGTTVPLERDERHFRVNFKPTSGRDSYLATYRPISGGFVLEPGPSETVTEGLRMEYHGLPAQLEVNGDSWHTDFPRSFDELIILDVVVAAFDSEGLVENGTARTVLRQRQDYEWDWERYVDNRHISTNKINPFVPHYGDA